MANKQALREFQSRLAQRLQSAQTSGVSASWLAVQARNLRLLLPLSHAGEIFSWTDVQKVPYTQPWFMGVANLRGSLSGVVDLAAFITGEADKPRADTALAQCRLVALNPVLEAHCALLVDALLGLRTMDSFAASGPAPEGAQPYFSNVYTDLDGGQWQEVSLQALSRAPGFLSIGV